MWVFLILQADGYVTLRIVISCRMCGMREGSLKVGSGAHSAHSCGSVRGPGTSGSASFAFDVDSARFRSRIEATYILLMCVYAMSVFMYIYIYVSMKSMDRDASQGGLCTRCSTIRAMKPFLSQRANFQHNF